MTSADPVNPLEAMRWNLDTLSGSAGERSAPNDIRMLIRSTDELPPLPEMSRQLMRLMDDPDADASDLARIVEQDPLLSSQMIRWSNSAYYGLRNPVESVKDAVARVLGFEQALNLALGLSALDPLQTPRSGPVGRDNVWRHGMSCAQLMLELRGQIPENSRPSTGLVQLAGLTQNIGYLLLGHLLPAQFAFLNRIIDRNIVIDLTVVEDFSLGVNHTQLGEWLLEAWEMPPALRQVVRHHHNPAFSGNDETLVLLCCLADKLLADTTSGVGPAMEESTLEALAQRLGISREQCTQSLDAVLGQR